MSRAEKIVPVRNISPFRPSDEILKSLLRSRKGRFLGVFKTESGEVILFTRRSHSNCTWRVKRIFVRTWRVKRNTSGPDAARFLGGPKYIKKTRDPLKKKPFRNRRADKHISPTRTKKGDFSHLDVLFQFSTSTFSLKLSASPDSREEKGVSSRKTCLCVKYFPFSSFGRNIKIFSQVPKRAFS